MYNNKINNDMFSYTIALSQCGNKQKKMENKQQAKSGKYYRYNEYISFNK